MDIPRYRRSGGRNAKQRPEEKPRKSGDQGLVIQYSKEEILCLYKNYETPTDLYLQRQLNKDFLFAEPQLETDDEEYWKKQILVNPKGREIPETMKNGHMDQEINSAMSLNQNKWSKKTPHPKQKLQFKKKKTVKKKWTEDTGHDEESLPEFFKTEQGVGLSPEKPKVSFIERYLGKRLVDDESANGDDMSSPYSEFSSEAECFIRPSPNHDAWHIRCWEYLDPQGREQGIFSTQEMRQWSDAGFFTGDLHVKFHRNQKYRPLRDIFPRHSGPPFNLIHRSVMSR